MKLLALLLAGFAAAPLRAVAVAAVRRAAPAGVSVCGAAMAGVAAHTRLGALTRPSLSHLPSDPILPQMAPPVLAPSAVRPAPAPMLALRAAGDAAAAVTPQAVSGAPLAAPAAAVKSLEGFAAQMESSRISGADLSGDISDRFFDQSGSRGPPPATPARASASDVAAPRIPPGVERLAVDTVRDASDVDRLIPKGPANDVGARLRSEVSDMAPYQIYTYHDSLGGRFTGIDISAHPEIVDQVIGMRPYELRLIQKLMLFDSDIRVLLREEGKTPDLVIGDKIVEMKSWFMDRDPLEKLLKKANAQIHEHGVQHGLGHGELAVDIVGEVEVPTARVQDILSSWQASSAEGVTLDRVIMFGERDVEVFVRQADGTYRNEAPATIARSVVDERPLALAEAGRARAGLRRFEGQSRPVTP